MLIRWTYYLIPRLMLGTMVFVFLTYGTLFVYNESMFPGNGGLPLFLIIITGLASFVLSWRMWSGAGRLQMKYLLSSAGESLDKRDFEAAGRSFGKARKILQESSHFPPDDASEDAVRFIDRYADFCCAAGWNDAASLSVYSEFFRLNPDDDKFARQLIPLITSSDDVRKENLPLLVKIHKLAGDADEMTNFLASNFISYEVYSAESQEALLETVRKYSPLRPLSLKFLLPRMLDQDRYDPVAMEIYLEAYNAGLEHRDLKPALGRIAEKANLGSYSGPISSSIKQVFDSLPQEERESIGKTIQRERLERVAVSGKAAESAREVDAPPEEAVIFTEDDDGGDYTDVFKPTPLLNLIAIVRRIFGLAVQALTYVVTLVLKLMAEIFRLIVREWKIARWIFAAGVVISLIYGLVNVVSTMRQPPVETSLEVVSDKAFTIQVAAFKDRARAEKAMLDMKPGPERPYISASRGETVWYQVRLGFYGTTEEAKRAAENMGIKNYFIANFSPGVYVE